MRFTFVEFLEQLKMMRSLEPLEKLLGKIPGFDQIEGVKIDEGEMKRTEAIILSMTVDERIQPAILNTSRRERVARGSGATVRQVDELILRFSQLGRA